MDAESQLLAQKDQEIEMMTEQAFKFRALCVHKDQLITELCDALESIPIVLHPPHRELIQRAREVTR